MITLNKRLIFLSLLIFLVLLSGSAIADTYNDFPSFQAGTSTLTLIDFDDYTGGLSNHYPGIIFGAVDYSGPALGPVSSPNAWFVPDDPFIFSAEFTSNDITAVGVYNVLNSGQSGATLLAYNSSNVLMGSVVSDTDIETLDFFGLTTTESIERFEVVFNSPPFGWGLDNLYFGQAAGVAPIPEPTTMILLGSGLIGILGLRRKFRK